jgi:hypothetical protein
MARTTAVRWSEGETVITVKPDKWDRVVDVVVVGSGGAALVTSTLAH